MQKAQERAAALSDPRELAALLDRWSTSGPFRRKLLGRQAVFQRATSTNVYFYTLNVLYETRAQVQTVEEPDHSTQAVRIEKEQDRWSVALPQPKGFVEEQGGTVTLPGSTRVLTCEVCNGPGRVACARCQGRARIIVQREPAKAGATAKSGGAATATASAPAQSTPALVPCPDCSGIGSLECERCEGAGRLLQRKTTTWRRRPASLSANDDLPALDERWLHNACKALPVYQEQQQGDVRPEWKLVPELAALITKAQNDAGADTRIALSEVQIAFIPITEIVFDLGETRAPAPAPAKGGKAKPARAADTGLYRWHIYGFEKQLPKDWRFLNWDRVLMLIFLRSGGADAGADAAAASPAALTPPPIRSGTFLLVLRFSPYGRKTKHRAMLVVSSVRALAHTGMTLQCLCLPPADHLSAFYRLPTAPFLQYAYSAPAGDAGREKETRRILLCVTYFPPRCWPAHYCLEPAAHPPR